MSKVSKPGFRDRFFTVLAIFSFLLCSSYVVLWNESNKNVLLAISSGIVFVVSVVMSNQWRAAVCAALTFTGIRWAIAALITAKMKATLLAIGFLGIAAGFFIMILRAGNRGRKLPPSA